MIDHEYKEVLYCDYCKKCKHENVKDTDNPCNECLDEPINLYSHKPVKFVEKEKNTGSRKKQSL